MEGRGKGETDGQANTSKEARLGERARVIKEGGETARREREGESDARERVCRERKEKVLITDVMEQEEMATERLLRMGLSNDS